ncbi:hypothetical protein [Sinorhizobium meliloti]|uniref:hypothetical protein n=1 Tax=Rhizobium meliloti TaxID=382 RepID=UPI0013E2EF0E|nr:hypothetical protein [Sinorhizobium meliloti]
MKDEARRFTHVAPSSIKVASSTFDEGIVVAENARCRCTRQQEVCDRSVTGVGWPDECVPWHEMIDENGLECVRGHEMLGQRFKIVAHLDIAPTVDFKLVLVEAAFSHCPSRRQAAWRCHRKAGSTDHKKATSIH